MMQTTSQINLLYRSDIVLDIQVFRFPDAMSLNPTLMGAIFRLESIAQQLIGGKMQITPCFHRIGGFVNQYLLVEDNELTLIDTGMPSNGKKVLDYLEKAGYKPENLKRILITHSDPDHYGAAQYIRTATGAEIWTSQLEADAMKIGSSSRDITPKGLFALIFPLLGIFFSTPPTPVDRVIKDGETLSILGGLQVIASPGHTPGHISFYLPVDQILIAGDAISAKNGMLIPTTNSTTGDPIQAKASFEKLMLLQPRIIGCGHAFKDLRK